MTVSRVRPAPRRFINQESALKTIVSTIICSLLFGAAPLALLTAAPSAHAADRIKNIVLVHGAFVDGSGWEAVYKRLTAKGYRVSIVQHPTTSLAADVAATKAVLDAQDGPVVLVGHSYGGVVITQAGNDPKVERLVYLAAFVPDNGESVQKLIAHPAPGAVPPPILPPVNGFIQLDKAKFKAAFGADLQTSRATFLADSQMPWGLEAVGGEVADAAWKRKPSWYLVATEDRMIPPDAQRSMAQRAGAKADEVRSSHAVYESKPGAVVTLIEKAAAGR
jgi:pimeloyl-ACP methyl ester carboxylesterase